MLDLNLILVRLRLSDIVGYLQPLPKQLRPVQSLRHSGRFSQWLPEDGLPLNGQLRTNTPYNTEDRVPR